MTNGGGLADWVKKSSADVIAELGPATAPV